jgi:hypothetical protein
MAHLDVGVIVHAAVNDPQENRISFCPKELYSVFEYQKAGKTLISGSGVCLFCVSKRHRTHVVSDAIRHAKAAALRPAENAWPQESVFDV